MVASGAGYRGYLRFLNWRALYNRMNKSTALVSARMHREKRRERLASRAR